jgi:hypothetical protein
MLNLVVRIETARLLKVNMHWYFQTANSTCWNAGEVSRQAVTFLLVIQSWHVVSIHKRVLSYTVRFLKRKKKLPVAHRLALSSIYIDNIRVVSALTKLAFAIFYKNSRRNLSQVSNLSQIFYPALSLLLIFPFSHHLFHIASAIREHSRRAVWSQKERRE